jgi:hypothetical protein
MTVAHQLNRRCRPACAHHLVHVQAQLAAQQQQIEDDVADFLPGMGQFVGGQQLARLVFAQPLENFHQFGHFDAGGHGQVFGLWNCFQSLYRGCGAGVR